jgi:hypothetical protein
MDAEAEAAITELRGRVSKLERAQNENTESLTWACGTIFPHEGHLTLSVGGGGFGVARRKNRGTNMARKASNSSMA